MTDVQHAGPLRLRIFLSSPGDVVDERNLARGFLKNELPSDPLQASSTSSATWSG